MNKKCLGKSLYISGSCIHPTRSLNMPEYLRDKQHPESQPQASKHGKQKLFVAWAQESHDHSIFAVTSHSDWYGGFSGKRKEVGQSTGVLKQPGIG